MSTGQRKNIRQNSNKPTRQDEPNSAAKATALESGMVSNYPMPTALVMFGIGIGVGVALGSLIGAQVAPPRSFGQRAELAAEKLGRQVLDALTGVLPQSVVRHVI